MGLNVQQVSSRKEVYTTILIWLCVCVSLNTSTLVEEFQLLISYFRFYGVTSYFFGYCFIHMVS